MREGPERAMVGSHLGVVFGVHVFGLGGDHDRVFGNGAMGVKGLDPVVHATAQVGEHSAVIGRVREVVDLVRVLLQVVEFLVGPVGREEFGLGVCEFALFGEHWEECPQRILLVLVPVELHVRAIWMVVANVLVLVRPHAANPIHCAIAPVAGRENFTARCGIVPQEDVALHLGRNIQPGERERGGGKVDAADEFIAHDARVNPRGPPRDAGHANAAVVEKLLVADVGAPVVRDEKNNGVVGYALVFEPLEHPPDLAVKHLNAFEVHGPIFSHERMIRIIRREFHRVRVDGVFRVGREIAVRVRDVVLRVKRLTLCALGPVDAVEDAFALKVEIGLAGLVKWRARAVARIISRVPKVVRDEANVTRQWDIALAAVIVRVNAGLVPARDDGRPARGTHRAGDKRIGKERPLRRQLVDIRGLHNRRAITGEIGIQVFAVDPEDVGFISHGKILSYNRWNSAMGSDDCFKRAQRPRPYALTVRRTLVAMPACARGFPRR